MSLTLKPDVLEHIVDVHCHPTDAPVITPEDMQNLSIKICAMSSMRSDQTKVAELASSYPHKVIPCFGYHPWFSHEISLVPTISKEDHYRHLFLGGKQKDDPDHLETFHRLLQHLPEPIPLASLLDEVRGHLSQYPNAMLGEVGLDRVFRVPFDYFAERRELTPFVVPLEHQLALLEAQLDLAVELERNVSVHSVKSQQATVELFTKLAKKHGDRWYRISIDMHSCGFSPETWNAMQKNFSNVFLSLSIVINSRHSNCRKLLVACAPDRILVESDYNDVGKVTEQTLEMIQLLADAKGWEIEQEWVEYIELEQRGVVRRLEDNWKRFQKGRHKPVESKGRRKKRLLESGSEDEGDR